jgi:hypothetical protein
MQTKNNIFGSSKLKEIKIGDLVRWHTLTKEYRNGYTENIGIVKNVRVDHRGGRDVAVASIVPLNDGSPTNEIEVFLACLKVVSKSVLG